VKHRVTIIGAADLPSHVAVHASQMWSRNMEKLLMHVSKDGVLVCDTADEIVRGCMITRGGEIVHEAAKAAAAAAAGAPAGARAEATATA
jgi:NAD(P) transhydrogenase subunit alpha